MVTEITTEAVVIIGGIVGTAARTLFPFWERLRENPDLLFERKFLGTAIVSFVSAIAIGVGLYPSLLANIQDSGVSGLSISAIFVITALAAYGLNSGANDLLKSKTITALEQNESKA